MKVRVYTKANPEISQSNIVSDTISDLIIDQVREFIDRENLSDETTIEFTIDIKNLKRSKYTIDKEIEIETLKN